MIRWRFDFSRNEEKSLRRLGEFFTLEVSPAKNVTWFYNIKKLDLELIRRKGIKYCGVCYINFYCTENDNTKEFIRALKILEADEFPLRFTRKLLRFTIPEDSKKGTWVATLINWVKDEDVSATCEGLKVRKFYLSKNGGPIYKFLEISNPENGTIVTANKLNYEALPWDHKYVNLRANAEDYSGHTTSVPLKLYIKNVDDEGPVFTTHGIYRAFVPKDYTGPVKISPKAIKAVDGDHLGAEITYSLEAVRYSPVSKYIQIDRNSGVVSVFRPMGKRDPSEIWARVVAVEYTQMRHQNKRFFIIRRKDAQSSVQKEPSYKKSLISAKVLAQGVTLLSVMVLIGIAVSKARAKKPQPGEQKQDEPNTLQEGYGNKEENLSPSYLQNGFPLLSHL